MQASRMWPLGLLLTCRPRRRAPEWQVYFEPLSWLSLSASWPARKLRPEARRESPRRKDCVGVQHVKKSLFLAASGDHGYHVAVFPPSPFSYLTLAAFKSRSKN